MSEYISKQEIILEEWKKGHPDITKKLERFRTEIEAFAYNCMESFENKLKKRKDEV